MAGITRVRGYKFGCVLIYVISPDSNGAVQIRASMELAEKTQPEVSLHKLYLRPPQVTDVRALGSWTSAAQKTCFPALRAME